MVKTNSDRRTHARKYTEVTLQLCLAHRKRTTQKGEGKYRVEKPV